MKPRGSLQHFKKSAACSYPKPDQSNPRFPIQILEKFILMDNIKIELKINLRLWGFLWSIRSVYKQITVVKRSKGHQEEVATCSFKTV